MITRDHVWPLCGVLRFDCFFMAPIICVSLYLQGAPLRHMHDPITILEILQNDVSHNMVIFLAFRTELNIRSSKEHLTDDQKGPKGEPQRNSGKV